MSMKVQYPGGAVLPVSFEISPTLDQLESLKMNIQTAFHFQINMVTLVVFENENAN